MIFRVLPVSLLVLALGCGGERVIRTKYPAPVTGVNVRPLLQRCAEQRGFEAREDNHGAVWVTYETGVTTHFDVDESVEVLQIDEVLTAFVPQNQVEAKVAFANGKGKEIYACALGGPATTQP